MWVLSTRSQRGAWDAHPRLSGRPRVGGGGPSGCSVATLGTQLVGGRARVGKSIRARRVRLCSLGHPAPSRAAPPPRPCSGSPASSLRPVPCQLRGLRLRAGFFSPWNAPKLGSDYGNPIGTDRLRWHPAQHWCRAPTEPTAVTSATGLQLCK